MELEIGRTQLVEITFTEEQLASLEEMCEISGRTMFSVASDFVQFVMGAVVDIVKLPAESKNERIVANYKIPNKKGTDKNGC